MYKSIIKILAVLLIVGLNWTGLSVVIETIAYYNDTENSAENTFSAATLDFSLASPADFSPEVTPTQNSVRNISVINDGILGFEYNLQTEDETGDLCNNLNLTVLRNGADIGYIGTLKDFTYDAGQFVEPDNWQFTANLTSNDPSLENKTCDFDFVFNGAQIGGAGFSDQEIIPNTIESGQWVVKQGDVVINELMWMGSYRNSDDEWLELRNMTDSQINISNWQLTKLTNSGESLMLEIPDGKLIPANGFFLISKFNKDDSAINVEPDLVDSNLVLRNLNLQIKLYKDNWSDSGNLIDVADDGKGFPLAGWHGFFFHLSMERNDVPEDGTLHSNWHTCLEFFGTRIYWDTKDIFNLGTPTTPNLSDEEDSGLEYYIQREKELLAEGIYPLDPISNESEEEPVVETEISVSDTELTDEVFEEIAIVEEVPTETIAKEVPVEPAEEVIPEIVPEEQPVIEEQPAIEENPPVIEQAQAQEEPEPEPEPNI